MAVTFIWYPRCSTCRKAAQWLDDHGIAHEDRHIVEENPHRCGARRVGGAQRQALEELLQHQRQPLQGAASEGSSPEMDDAARFDLLATNGMLVKRPIVQ